MTASRDVVAHFRSAQFTGVEDACPHIVLALKKLSVEETCSRSEKRQFQVDENGWIKQQGILLAEWMRRIFCQPIEYGRCHSLRQEPGKTPSHNDVSKRAARTVQTARHTIRRTVCLGLIAIVSPFQGYRFLTTIHEAAATLAKLAFALPWVVEATNVPTLKG